MPTGKDFLAVTHGVIVRMARRPKQTGRKTLQITKTHHLEIPTTALDGCICKAGKAYCHCITSFAINGADDTKSDGGEIKKMLDKFPNGAMVISEAKLVKK